MSLQKKTYKSNDPFKRRRKNVAEKTRQFNFAIKYFSSKRKKKKLILKNVKSKTKKKKFRNHPVLMYSLFFYFLEFVNLC